MLQTFTLTVNNREFQEACLDAALRLAGLDRPGGDGEYRIQSFVVDENGEAVITYVYIDLLDPDAITVMGEYADLVPRNGRGVTEPTG